MGSPEVHDDRGAPEKEVSTAVPPSFHSKLPVLERSKLDEFPVRHTSDALSKMVGLETLYGVLSEEHLGLQITLKEVTRRLRQEECKRRELEIRLAACKQDNPINLALAERIQALEQSEAKLRRENVDLRDENDLLEFRILEMDESNTLNCSKKSNNNSKIQQDTKNDLIDIDDVSDSGVMSLSTSDDEHQHEFNMEGRTDRDVKSRLLSMCQSAATVSERICLQQALALLRHYEARIEGLEATIAAMCHEATMSRTLYKSGRLLEAELDQKTSNATTSTTNGRIIATVLPFTEPPSPSDILCPVGATISKLNGSDCLPQLSNGNGRCRTQADSLTESGVFEAEDDEEDDDDEDDLVISLYTRGTQTETSCQSGEDSLTAELEKLTRIRERIEEKKGGTSQQPQLKDVLFYESRVSALESRLAVYESSSDERHKVLSAQLERETLLTAQVSQLKEKLARLSAENRRLEEERSELEEMENDTRLRCQKLELKVGALSDKKKGLKKQVEDLRKEMTGREEERKHMSRMEALVNAYEQKNHELEEKELEVRYRLQMLENTMPALMMWNLWRMMMVQSTGGAPPVQPQPQAVSQSPGTSGVVSAPIRPDGLQSREEELMVKLKSLEGRLTTETKLLEDSKMVENQLRTKVKELEQMLVSKDNNILEILNRDPDEDQEVFEKLSKMARERVDMDRRIKDLELKEKLYQETLQQADAMFSQMEGSFAQQMKEKDDVISEQEEKIEEHEGRLRQAARTSELANELQEKLILLEQEVKEMKKVLELKEQEIERLEKEEKELQLELQETLDELQRMKESIEGPLLGQISEEKQKSLSLSRELTESEELRAKEEDQHADETAIMKLRSVLTETISEKEELKERLEAKVEEMENQLEQVKKKPPPVPPRSLKEEFEDIIVLEGKAKEAIAKELHTSQGDYRLVRIEEIRNVEDEEIETDFEEFGINYFKIQPPNEPPPPPPTMESLPSEITNNDEISEKNLKNIQLNDNTIFEMFGNKKASVLPNELQVQLEADNRTLFNQEIKEEPLPYYLSGLSLECNFAHQAVSGASGKNLPKAMENLSKAYQHSKSLGNLQQ